MLVKFFKAGDHLKYLQETFDILRKYNIKLNPEKRAFGVGSDTFLGFLVSQRVNIEVFGEVPSLLFTFEKEERFRVDLEFQHALKDLKRYLSSSSLLSKLDEGEQLLIYLVVSEVAAVKVSEFDIEYKPRTAIKSQVLADFVVDVSPGLMPLDAKEAVLVPGTVSRFWTLFTDGASNVKGSGLGVVLITHLGETLRQAIRTVSQTNNEVEYDALVVGLELAQGLGSEFIGSKVTKFLGGLKIKRIKSSPYHPSANGKGESTNKIIIQNLKMKLEDTKGKWPDELPGVLWAYRTTAKSSTGETPFSVINGSKALIPIEVGEPTLRSSRANAETNNEALLPKLDLLEEHRNLAYVWIVAQKQRMKRYYNRIANF
nr:uncharacterized protein LOC117279615 [Nicotiana tomentosiformis]